MIVPIPLPLLWLARAAIDIVAFFLVVRLVARADWAPRWIAAFDTAGAALVDGVVRFVDRTLRALTGARWRDEAKIVLSLLLLWLLRWAV